MDFFKKRFVWVLSFIIDEKNICPVSNFRHLQHWGQESHVILQFRNLEPVFPAGDPREVLCCFMLSRSKKLNQRRSRGPLALSQTETVSAASPPWGRHSNLGQPPGQVPAEGPCARHLIPED